MRITASQVRKLPQEPDHIAPCTLFDMLTDRQIAALVACPESAEYDGEKASDIGAHPSTLMSLNDLWRDNRDCLPPIMLTTWERGCWDGKRYWRRTKLGDRVLESALPHERTP